MVRKALLGVLASMLVASVALAEESPVGATVSTTVASMYEWNGFDVVKERGLDEGPVVQPNVSVGVKNTGLSFSVGGSFVMNEDSQLHEAKYGVSVVRSASPIVDVGVGYNFYDDRVKEVGGVATVDNNKHEGWGSVAVKSAVGVVPGVTVKYEKPGQDGVDGFAVVVGSVDYSVPMSGVTLGSAGVDVKLHSGVVYNSSVKANNVEVLKGGVSAVQFGVSSGVKAGRVVVTPAVNYQVTLRDEVVGTTTQNADNEFWATVGVAYGF
jgi:hypothetical protein